MAKVKYYTIIIRGRNHTWSLPVNIRPQDVEDYRADGLHIYEVVNVVPEQLAGTGLVAAWCRLQDLWSWLRGE